MFKSFMYSFIGAAVVTAASSAPCWPTAPRRRPCRDRQVPAAAFTPANPFYAPSSLPLQAPPWDKIKDSDYQPAFEAGMKQQLAEVDEIANNPAAPTFDNTIVAMEKSGQLLNRVGLVFGTVTGANTDDTLQKVQEETAAPKLQATQDCHHPQSQAVRPHRDALRPARQPEAGYRAAKHLLELLLPARRAGRRQALATPTRTS